MPRKRMPASLDVAKQSTAHASTRGDRLLPAEHDCALCDGVVWRQRDEHAIDHAIDGMLHYRRRLPQHAQHAQHAMSERVHKVSVATTAVDCASYGE